METGFAMLPDHLLAMGKSEGDTPKAAARREMFMLLEEEREWVVQLLQDDIGQLLSIAAMELHGDENQAANQHLTMALNRLRSLTFELKPYLLQHFDLHTAIIELFKHRFAANPGCCTIKVHAYALGSRMETAIFRLVQKTICSLAAVRLSCCEFELSRAGLQVQLKCRFEVHPLDAGLLPEIHQPGTALQTLIYLLGGEMSCRAISDNQLELFMHLQEDQLP